MLLLLLLLIIGNTGGIISVSNGNSSLSAISSPDDDKDPHTRVFRFALALPIAVGLRDFWKTVMLVFAED
jgi:hypothetical protein